MKTKFKLYFKLNIMSVFFVAVSFISITLAWFAYSGTARGNVTLDVKTWLIELSKNGNAVSDSVTISLSEVYPGMQTVNEVLNIKNLGDSDAQVHYSIASARILGESKDDYIVDDINVFSDYVEDVISHNYPFHVNINLDKNYTSAKGGENTFRVSISWPLDSGDDHSDSLWGIEAYKFKKNEEEIKNNDPNHQVRPAIQIKINITAEQYIETNESSDVKYNAGDMILFDVVDNKKCESISPTCLKTHVIDENNTLGNTTVSLLLDPIHAESGNFGDYNLILNNFTDGWTVNTKSLDVSDVLKIVSTDILSSVLVRNNVSDKIIGNLNYNNRMNSEINKAINSEGYYRFSSEKFGYISPSSCYWTASEYNVNSAFAINKIDEHNSKIYGELKSEMCKILPVLIVDKSKLFN